MDGVDSDAELDVLMATSAGTDNVLLKVIVKQIRIAHKTKNVFIIFVE